MLFNLISGFSTKQESLETLLQRLKLDQSPFVKMNQTHSNHVVRVEKNTLPVDLTIPDTDGIWTTEGDLVLGVKTADCLPILIYHQTGVVGGIHAGRKSTEQGIVKVFFADMEKTLGLRTGFTIWFGPAICKACYQIDPIADLHYDLVAENKAQLSEIIDVNESALEISGLCTSCHNERFYSYRKERTQERIWTVAKLSA